MRRGILLFCLMGLCPFSLGAQVKMADVLKAMPDSLIPYLTENNRLDCLDFKEAGMKAEVRNALDGKTELVTLTDSYARLRLNPAVTTSFRLLDGDSQMICVVTTYGTDFQESKIAFYTTDWQPLPTADYVALPDGLFTAVDDGQENNLTITLANALDRPALEEQKEEKEIKINLKWEGRKYKEY